MGRPSPQPNAPHLGFLIICISLIMCVGEPGWAQKKEYGHSPNTTAREAEIYDNYVKPGVGGGVPAGAANILGGLIEKLGSGAGKVNPNPPGLTIDEALKDFEVRTVPVTPTATPL